MIANRKIKFCTVFLLFLLGWPNLSQAQQPTSEQTQALQAELDRIEQEIKAFETELNGVKSAKNTLSKKISQLKIQQNKIKAQIRESNLQIAGIESELVVIEQSIEERRVKILALETSLGDLLRLMNKQDHRSVLEVLASGQSVGQFFSELGDYKKLSSGLRAAVAEMEELVASLTGDEIRLAGEKDNQQNLIAIKSLQSQELTENLQEHGGLLNKTKEQESEYQALLADRRKKAGAIRGRIYELLGVGKQVTFGQAVEIAQWAQGVTGVRAAFLLAILSQESNLGKNVGTCNRPGDPPEKSWTEIMKPERDQEPFLKITEELGMDPNVTPVSCPMRDTKGNRVGWGGAMGPAQFIPSTWMGYKDKVAAITGKSANPWDIRDAFLAAALLLKANGAASEEWSAAMRYFSGGTNVKFRFYGDNVVAKADKYQEDIEALKE